MKKVLTALAILVILACYAVSAPADAATRSYSAKSQFANFHACPSTGKHTVSCRGYVIDHIQSLDCGGQDVPGNMQWQTTAEGKAKDKWERNGLTCLHRTHGVRP